MGRLGEAENFKRDAMTKAQEIVLIDGLRKAGLLESFIKIEIQIGENEISNLKVTKTENRNKIKFSLTSANPVSIIG